MARFRRVMWSLLAFLILATGALSQCANGTFRAMDGELKTAGRKAQALLAAMLPM